MHFSQFRLRPAHISLYFLTALLASCGNTIAVEDQDSIIIRNHSDQAIHSLLVKPCTKSYDEFEEMAQNLQPGSMTVIRLYPGCFDADALHENGEPMATQYKLRLPPQLRWDVY